MSILVGLGILAYLILALSFTESKMNGQRVLGIAIDVRDLDVVRFVTEEDVLENLVKHRVSITNEPIDSINKAYVKELVIDMPQVRSSEVYFTPDGQFHIKIWQRIPVMRVLTDRYSYYVDQDGASMPVSSNFTSTVPVFTGNISPDILAAGLFELATFLKQDEFWAAQIDQIQVWDSNNIELVPRIGDHRIFIGSVENLPWKFEKLRALYEKALPLVGWDLYESIDLRYGDQVVCKKKS